MRDLSNAKKIDPNQTKESAQTTWLEILINILLHPVFSPVGQNFITR